MSSSESAYIQYLQAKKRIDERSIHPRTWNRFIKQMGQQSGETVHIQELGCGLGDTAIRVVEALSQQSVNYTLVDVRADVLEAARENIFRWAHRRNARIKETTAHMEIEQPTHSWLFRFVEADAVAHIQDLSSSINAVIAQSFIDLINCKHLFQALQKQISSPILGYFPICFDGLTDFLPRIPKSDQSILRAYHASMSKNSDNHIRGSQSGRMLLSTLNEISAYLIDVSSSDWIVHPRNNSYSDEEKYFLHYIIHFIEHELNGKQTVDDCELDRWLKARHDYIDNNNLIYIAHQLDILATIYPSA